jgi:hypothetical protein
MVSTAGCSPVHFNPQRRRTIHGVHRRMQSRSFESPKKKADRFMVSNAGCSPVHLNHQNKVPVDTWCPLSDSVPFI